jgi:hypothetical protein
MIDRRKLRRIRLRCAIALWNPRDGSVTSTWTEDLSCRGFFCLSVEAYSIGDELQASLELPVQGLKVRRGMASLALQCQVVVLRVTHLQEKYGITCQIEDYSVIGNRSMELSKAAPRLNP